MNIFTLIAIIMPIILIPIPNTMIKGVLLGVQIICMIIGLFKMFNE